MRLWWRSPIVRRSVARVWRKGGRRGGWHPHGRQTKIMAPATPWWCAPDRYDVRWQCRSALSSQMYRTRVQGTAFAGSRLIDICRPSTSSLSPCPPELPSCVARQHILLVPESVVRSSIRLSPHHRPPCRPGAAAKPETRIVRLGHCERAKDRKLYLYYWNDRQPTVECSALYSDPGTLCQVAMGGDHGESHQVLLGERLCGR